MEKIRVFGNNKTWDHISIKDNYSISTGDCVVSSSSIENGAYPIISGGTEPMGYLNHFNRNGNTVTVARAGAAGFVGYQKNNFYLNDKCFSLDPLKKYDIDPLFLYFYLKTFEREIVNLRVASAVPTINTVVLGDLNICFPDKTVQGKIASVLENLDTYLSFLENERCIFAQLKKTMLYKMFPQNDNLLPEIRFKGYSGTWENSTIGKKAIITTGGTPSTSVKKYWEKKEIPWLSSGEVHKKRITFTDDMISKEGLVNSSAKWVKENSVVLALAGQGKTRGTVAITYIPLTTNQSIASITPNETLDSEFLFQLLEGKYQELRELSSGEGGRGGLNKQMVSDFHILVPTKNEQVKIGKFFVDLDNVINNTDQEIKILQHLKLALMNQIMIEG